MLKVSRRQAKPEVKTQISPPACGDAADERELAQNETFFMLPR